MEITCIYEIFEAPAENNRVLHSLKFWFGDEKVDEWLKLCESAKLRQLKKD
jgi:hypothetical protein